MQARWRYLGMVLTVATSTFSTGQELTDSDWPQFRGRNATGVADRQPTPTEWDVESFHNVLWKAPIEGLGLGSPVIAGHRMFVVTAIGEESDPSLRVGLYGDIASVPDESEHRWQLLCFDKHTGRVLWERTLHQGVPAIKRHTKASHANSTPATDGRHVVVFLGSEGLHCYDVSGNLIWKKDLGVLDSGYYVFPAAQWGFGSSPIIDDDKVYIQSDVQENSFVAAFDIHGGDELWRTERDDVPSWGTPTIYRGERSQLIVNGYRHSGGYDPETGDELWKISGGGDIPVPTPVVSDDLIILSSSHGNARPLRAISLDASGEITPDDDGGHEHIAWNNQRDGVYMPTPLAYGEYLYACRINGVLSCYNRKTGERIYRERLGNDAFTASPVAADGKLYFTSEKGNIYVVRAGEVHELLATNSINDICMATPAISNGVLYVRTKSHIYAIGTSAAQKAMVETDTTSHKDNLVVSTRIPSQSGIETAQPATQPASPTTELPSVMPPTVAEPVGLQSPTVGSIQIDTTAQCRTPSCRSTRCNCSPHIFGCRRFRCHHRRCRVY